MQPETARVIADLVIERDGLINDHEIVTRNAIGDTRSDQSGVGITDSPLQILTRSYIKYVLLDHINARVSEINTELADL